jgi:glycosyltransferase involved in cell wall biosynthesis
MRISPGSSDIRICWLLPTAWFYWQPSLSELAKVFLSVKVFTGLFPGFAQGFEGSIDVEVVGTRKVFAITKSQMSYGNNFTSLSPQIILRLFKYKPDVILSSSFGIWSILALLFKYLGGWKVIIAYEGSSPGVDYRNSVTRLLLRRLMVFFADACITNSHTGKDYLINYLNATESTVFVQPYEVPDLRSFEDDNNFSQTISNLELSFNNFKRPVFIFVGSLVPRKGVRCLVEACSHLKKAGNHSFSILILGDGPQRQELEALSHECDLNDQIIWTGRIDYADIATYFHYSDIFVLPTLEDTWGMVVLEAMLLGKPILCSDGAGASELIEEGQNGYRFEAGNSEELAAMMKKFIDNPEKIDDMGKASKRIMEKYTPAAAAEMMSKVIRYVTGT